jgi:hypothetical protein
MSSNGLPMNSLTEVVDVFMERLLTTVHHDLERLFHRLSNDTRSRWHNSLMPVTFSSGSS